MEQKRTVENEEKIEENEEWFEVPYCEEKFLVVKKILWLIFSAAFAYGLVWFIRNK